MKMIWRILIGLALLGIVGAVFMFADSASSHSTPNPAQNPPATVPPSATTTTASTSPQVPPLIIAYYGNFYSTRMGILGQYPPEQVLKMLSNTVAEWAAADPSLKIVPAIHYIAVSAQNLPGKDGKYRLRMPASQINKAIEMADKINGLVFLDIQVGHSNVETEIPLLEPYLKLPNVSLALDPEFAMSNGKVPGTMIGSMDAADVNFAVNYLSNLVKQNKLPPKILVVHRFTQNMLTDYKNIQLSPDVMIVIDMDGFGPASLKKQTYRSIVAREPVQFTGFKLFFKNDVASPGSHLMTPAEVLRLNPKPTYIQYQ